MYNLSTTIWKYENMFKLFGLALPRNTYIITFTCSHIHHYKELLTFTKKILIMFFFKLFRLIYLFVDKHIFKFFWLGWKKKIIFMNLISWSCFLKETFEGKEYLSKLSQKLNMEISWNFPSGSKSSRSFYAKYKIHSLPPR